ncbi:MAG: 3-hydroxybutyryl-CoA dehydrogenase [Candidatus Kapaibacterium sp.]|nr:MAG: 3-hydroxybutyryl-CoA dehydrogenase [Candidatus Kapabacteria bacterium]
MPEIRTILVVGAGTMGNGIAHVAAQCGYSVRLVDVSADRLSVALQTIESNLARQAKKGTISESDIPTILARITQTTDLPAAARDADIAIEAASENFDVKRSIFETLDNAAPEHCILASNTSSISITAIAATTARADRVIGMHFFNPVPVMKLCEIVRGQSTSDQTYATTFALAQALGKTPVTVQDYPGFVSNRILMPMINEAIYCLMEGVASAEDIDTVMKLGMNHPMGPLQLADFIGLDVCLAIMEVLHEGLGDDKYRPCPLLRRMVAAGLLGRKTGRGFYSY